MGKCPLYRNGKCSFADSLTGSEGYKYKHCLCEGRGATPYQWQECAKYDSTKIPLPIEIAKKEQSNMKIGIIIGIIIGFIIALGFGIGEYMEIGNVIRMILVYSVIGAFYGIGFSSISTTFYALEDFLGEGCFSIILFLFVMPVLIVFGVTSIVGIVRYFKRMQLLQ